MKIKLNFDLPLDPKHNMIEGREFEVLEEERKIPIASKGVKQSGRLIGYWVDSKGELILILKGEAEVINA